MVSSVIPFGATPTIASFSNSVPLFVKLFPPENLRIYFPPKPRVPAPFMCFSLGPFPGLKLIPPFVFFLPFAVPTYNFFPSPFELTFSGFLIPPKFSPHPIIC